jgi:hypothetical protein
LLFGFGSLWFWFAISKAFHFFNQYLQEGFYVGNEFYVDLPFDINEINVTLSLIGSILNAIGYIIFLISFEVATKRTHYILPIYQILFTVIMLVLTFFYISLFPALNTILTANSVVLVALIFIWLLKNTRDELQGFSVAMTIGLFIFYLGIGIDANVYYVLKLYPTWFPALFLISGALITLLPTIVTPERFTRPLFLWEFFSIFETLIILSIFYLFSFWSQFPIFANVGLILGLIFNFLILGFGIIRIFRILKPSKALKEPAPQEEKVKDFITSFTKPQRITEEEVSISKEKKICLVCKGNVGGLNFMCSDCGAFYCVKCSEALSNLENACWVCNTPFDESKPVKMPEIKEEKVEIEEMTKKDVNSKKSN